jgi:hypothetical protein
LPEVVGAGVEVELAAADARYRLPSVSAPSTSRVWTLTSMLSICAIRVPFHDD